MADTMENLIDLGKFAQNDVELISREFLRVVYLETLDEYVKEHQKSDADKTVLSNIEGALQGLETTIILLDGGTEFLDYVHQGEGAEDASNDEEFDRF
jgi:acetyl-CoA carboxylase beta subunit